MAQLDQLPSGIQQARFAVHERPYCVWGWDLHQRNLDFLVGLQPDYFSHMASRHGPELEGDEGQVSALALRTAYGQALETFFALVCAIIQAPVCVVGWMQFYRQEDLEAMVRAITDGHGCLSMLQFPSWSWRSVSDACSVGLVLDDKAKEAAIRKGFGSLWSRLAADFLDEGVREEYNQLKHGLRVRPGGFRLALGREDTPGVPAPPENMFSLGGGAFGTSYSHPERLGSTKRHFLLKSSYRNWEPGALAGRLQLLEMSINNLVSWAETLNGVDASTVQFAWPAPIEAFDHCLKERPGAFSFSLGRTLDASMITELSEQEILRVYEKTDDREPTL